MPPAFNLSQDQTLQFISLANLLWSAGKTLAELNYFNFVSNSLIETVHLRLPCGKLRRIATFIKCPHLSVVSIFKDRGYCPATTKGRLRRQMQQHRNEIMGGQKKAVKLMTRASRRAAGLALQVIDLQEENFRPGQSLRNGRIWADAFPGRRSCLPSGRRCQKGRGTGVARRACPRTAASRRRG